MKEKTYVIHTNSVEETQQLGEKISSILRGGDVITLSGDLGAGKTSFTQGIARGLGIKRVVNSPTFTIIKEYEGNLPLYHMDVYRLDEGGEDLGFDEYFYGEGVTVVEWPQMIADFLPSERLEITITREGEEQRAIRLLPFGTRFIRLCEEIGL
ncbi:MAG TPA: tRNA (adenosine(37)-N6)-threonylcarbamoyltransferase complex ATPase subunit type 1 TsaE [Paenibacillaceae bacterium]|nr:tRNA (adenosine(37)-N6)-threonylcarbamoyltransferase complex ATPase subunit type 1 TsaE [Paenibacillaceae bacterium]